MIQSVSVVVPCFNVVPYLEEAVSSALVQTHPPQEIILIDDGSTDGTAALATSLALKHPALIRAERFPHRGAAAARNTGLDLARGEWIAFLDSDDVWEPSKLEVQLRAAVEAPELNLIASYAYVLGTNRIVSKADSTHSDLRLELLLNGMTVVLSTTLFRRDLVGRHRFDESLEGAQDLAFLFRVAANARFRIIHQPLAAYRQRQGSITSSTSGSLAQLRNHYRLTRAQAERLAIEDPDTHLRFEKMLEARLAKLSRDLAYLASVAPALNLRERSRLVIPALRSDPTSICNYLRLLESLLPPRLTSTIRLLRSGDNHTRTTRTGNV